MGWWLWRHDGGRGVIVVAVDGEWGCCRIVVMAVVVVVVILRVVVAAVVAIVVAEWGHNGVPRCFSVINFKFGEK